MIHHSFVSLLNNISIYIGIDIVNFGVVLTKHIIIVGPAWEMSWRTTDLVEWETPIQTWRARWRWRRCGPSLEQASATPLQLFHSKTIQCKSYNKGDFIKSTLTSRARICNSLSSVSLFYKTIMHFYVLGLSTAYILSIVKTRKMKIYN